MNPLVPARMLPQSLLAAAQIWAMRGRLRGLRCANPPCELIDFCHFGFSLVPATFPPFEVYLQAHDQKHHIFKTSKNGILKKSHAIPVYFSTRDLVWRTSGGNFSRELIPLLNKSDLAGSLPSSLPKCHQPFSGQRRHGWRCGWSRRDGRPDRGQLVGGFGAAACNSLSRARAMLP